MFNSTIEPEDIKRVCSLAVREVFGDGTPTPDQIFESLKIQTDTSKALMFWLMDAVYVLAAESRPNEPHGTVEEQVCAIRHTESQYDVLFSDGDVVKYLFPKTYNQLGTPQTSEAALGIDDWLRFWWLFEGIFHSPAEDDAESAALNMLACDQAVREADRAKLAIVIYYMITDEPETAPLS